MAMKIYLKKAVACFLVQQTIRHTIHVHAHSSTENETTVSIRRLDWRVRSEIIPLVKNLTKNTSIYHEWPPRNLGTKLPDFVNAAVIKQLQIDPTGITVVADTNPLMGPAIHVVEGERMEVGLTNELPTSGLSLHWHGFELSEPNAWLYDGVVGVTQCPLSPKDSFVYNMTVRETPGTYWYHTHAGNLRTMGTNAIKGPLIVHPRSSRYLVDELNGVKAATSGFSALSYENERILFFSDGFLSPAEVAYQRKLGGLLGPASKNDDGFTVGSTTWEFGTCNGKLRELIQVERSRTYRFRMINGGGVFALRISIDGDFPMTVVATDSEPVRPYLVDQVILHTAERFDVELSIPENTPLDSKFWIRADTLESRVQGYQNGIRAVLHVVDSLGQTGNAVQDPIAPIESPSSWENAIALNCYSRAEQLMTEDRGGCMPITDLEWARSDDIEKEGGVDDDVEFHTVDFEFQPPPQFAHFVRIDGGLYIQHVNPTIAMASVDFSLEDHMHPHTAVLSLPANSNVIIIWRNRSLMDHPMHLHGLKMEILEVNIPVRERDCTIAKCNLNDAFSSSNARSLLVKKRIGQSPMKDTFILPAGGAVATRIRTREPAIWFAHCHIDIHRDDGMSFLVQVGGDVNNIRNTITRYPTDYPSCDTPFIQTQVDYPSCTCYRNKDAVLGLELTTRHRCSRDHLCYHLIGSIANLPTYKHNSGVSIHSDYIIPNWSLGLLVVAIVAFVTMIARRAYAYRLKHVEITSSSRNSAPSKEAAAERATAAVSEAIPEATGNVNANTDNSSISSGRSGSAQDDNNNNSSKHDVRIDTTTTTRTTVCCYWKQFSNILELEWNEYRPTCINLLRVCEVTGLALITGILFYNVGDNNTSNGLGQKTSLLFFSTTLWTFTRMYPAVGSYYNWKKRIREVVQVEEDQVGVGRLLPLFLVARMFVVLVAESIWPLIYTFVCFPLASLAGDVSVLFKISLLLCLNNLCYISLGSSLGVAVCSVVDGSGNGSGSIPLGMIASTIFSQTSLVAAGFYTTLPTFVRIVRYISPVFWTFSGMVKIAYRWSDTYDCVIGGQSDVVGTNNCYLEYNPIINNGRTWY